MTLAHVFYIPAIFLMGLLFGILISGNGRNADNEAHPSAGKTVTSKYLITVFLIFVCVFLITHVFPVPNGVKLVQSALGGMELFDKHPSFSAKDVYQRISKFPSSGIEAYKRFTYTIDVIFPASLFFFLITLYKFTSASLRVWRPVLLLPYIWLSLDLIENISVFILLSRYPSEVMCLASVLGFVTVLKFLMLLMSLAMPAGVFILSRIGAKAEKI